MLDCFALSGRTGSIVSRSRAALRCALGFGVEAFQARKWDPFGVQKKNGRE